MDGEFSCVNCVMSVLKPDDFEGVRVKPIFFDFLSSLAAKQGMGKKICILYGNERKISRMDFVKKIQQTDIILFFGYCFFFFLG